MSVQAHLETLRGEGLKLAAEHSLHLLAGTKLGCEALEAYAFGPSGRIIDNRLATQVAGVAFENPLIVGAGWDKTARSMIGLHALGFAGVEVGTITLHPQYGNPRPRLWTIDKSHSVGLNRLGFNSKGMETVQREIMAAQPLTFPLGINVGRNKLSTNERSIEEHAQVIRELAPLAAYVTLGISSPNTSDLRALQGKEFLPRLLLAAKDAITEAAPDANVPLFIKIDVERTPQQLDDIVAVALDESIDGIVATNTYMSGDLKKRYGARWASEAGGLSGADPHYQHLSREVIRYLYEAAGDRLAIIGAGGVNSWQEAYQKMAAGASALQIVTAIRETKGRVAASILRDMRSFCDVNKLSNISEIVGWNSLRGSRPIENS